MEGRQPRGSISSMPSPGDFAHLALRVENQGQLSSPHSPELGHKTYHATHKDDMSPIFPVLRSTHEFELKPA